jgi:hypothetical protein
MQVIGYFIIMSNRICEVELSSFHTFTITFAISLKLTIFRDSNFKLFFKLFLGSVANIQNLFFQFLFDDGFRCYSNCFKAIVIITTMAL